MEELEFEDYMANSGTRTSEPLDIYKKKHSMTVRTRVFNRRPDGLWEEVIQPKRLKKLIPIYW